MGLCVRLCVCSFAEGVIAMIVCLCPLCVWERGREEERNERVWRNKVRYEGRDKWRYKEREREREGERERDRDRVRES